MWTTTQLTAVRIFFMTNGVHLYNLAILFTKVATSTKFLSFFKREFTPSYWNVFFNGIFHNLLNFIKLFTRDFFWMIKVKAQTFSRNITTPLLDVIT